MEEKEEVVEQQTGQKVREAVRAFVKKWGWLIAIGLALVAIGFLFAPVLTYRTRVYDEFGEKIDTYFTVNLITYFSTGFALNWTMMVTLSFIGLGIIFSILGKWKKDLNVAASMFFLLALCFLALAKGFFEAEENAVENFKDASIGWGDGWAIAFMTLSAGLSLSQSYDETDFTIRDIAEDGILIAAAFGLNFIKIPVGPTGGSINLQMLPLMIIALRRGPFHGLVSGGIVYGLLTCLTDGYGFACYPFDYLIGFGSVAVLGFFRPFILGKRQTQYNLKGELFLLLAGILSTIVRYIGSNASSMIIYGLDLPGALAYNGIYIPLSGALAFAVIMALYGPLAKVNQMFPAKRGGLNNAN